MNSILLSFLCGSAFIGGAAMVAVMVNLYVSRKNGSEARAREAFNDRLMEYWRRHSDSEAVMLIRLGEIRDAIFDRVEAIKNRRK